MTVPRVGVDLVALARARQLVEPNYRAILERMLRSEEIDECTRSGVLDASAVAGRLAVKEAVFKLLRTREPVVPWHGIVVRGTPGTWPEVHLSGHAAELARHARLIAPVAVSVAHDGDYAVGVATALAAHHVQALLPLQTPTIHARSIPMSQSITTAFSDVKKWVLSKHPERTDIPSDLDLIETRLVDSLSFIEFIFVIEQASGRDIDTESLDLNQLRTLEAIEQSFFD
jgi:phosphopantetheine--protein transferase-like protein